MKKAFKFLLAYIVYFLVIVAIGTLFYMTYLGIVNTTAGQKFVVWDRQLFFKALFYICVCATFLVMPFLVTYRIRHKGGFSQCLAYFLICVINWGILFPVFLNQANKVDYKALQSVKKVNSADYFRNSGNEIYYFTEDLVQDGSAVPSVVISPKKDVAVEYKDISADQDFVLFKQSAQYNDIFTKNALSNDFIFSFVNINLILTNATAGLEKGWTFWLGFLSLALVISSIYWLANIFDWKLLDTALVVVVFAAILLCNTYYFAPAFLNFKLNYLSGSFFTFLCKYFDNSPLVLFNLLTSFIFMIIGIVKFFIKRKSKSE